MAILPKYTGGVLFDIRHLVSNSIIWVSARDVADMLEYSNPTEACRDNVKPKYRKFLHELTDTSKCQRNEGNSIYISEYGLYSWLATSKQEKAQPFQDYLYEELLPRLRKDIWQQQASLTSELQLHHKVVSFLRKYQPQAIVIAGLGELQCTSEKRLYAWRCGYRSGQPDLVVCNHHRDFSGVVIEFKAPNGLGKLSDKQTATLEAYRKANYKVMVSNCYEDILVELIDYFMNTRVCCSFCTRKFKTEKSLKSHELNFHKRKTNSKSSGGTSP